MPFRKLIPLFTSSTLTVSNAKCLPVYRKLITWSTNTKRPVNLTWKLAIFRQRVFLTRLALRFTYVNQACHFETNQVHVGGALGERHEINKSSLEIFDCILLSTRMIRLWKFYSCSFIPNWTRLFKFACNTDLNDNFRRQNWPSIKSGTCRNIAEHSGTSRNMQNNFHEKNIIN